MEIKREIETWDEQKLLLPLITQNTFTKLAQINWFVIFSNICIILITSALPKTQPPHPTQKNQQTKTEQEVFLGLGKSMTSWHHNND